MAFKDELAEPWGMVIGALAGGAAWAVQLNPIAAAGIGAATWLVKSAIDYVLDRDPDAVGGRLLPVRSKSPEERWVRRAERAVRSFKDLAGSVRPGPIAAKCASIGEQARTTIEAMERLAGQASAVALALRHLDRPRLASEEQRLSAAASESGEKEVRSELERSLGSVREQIAVNDRLEQAGRTLLAKMESGTIGLEGLVARLAEVLALAETAGGPAQETSKIDALADELEGLRSGLVETEDLSRRALSAYHEQATIPQSPAKQRNVRRDR